MKNYFCFSNFIKSFFNKGFCKYGTVQVFVFTWLLQKYLFTVLQIIVQDDKSKVLTATAHLFWSSDIRIHICIIFFECISAYSVQEG